jgi:APA family basic amino acid/polyamine antiporter
LPLKRTLRPIDLLLIVIGTVIGSGVFIAPALVLRQVGNAAGPALLVWVVGGVLALLGALTYAEMGAARPDAGGLYAYLRDAFGPLTAFLYGWTEFVVIGSGSIATLAVAFSLYMQQLVPLSAIASKVVACTVIAVVMVVNVLGTRRGANLQNVTTGIKASVIVVMSVLLLAGGHGLSGGTTQWSPAHGWSSIVAGAGISMIAVLWAYEGWQYATFAAGETKDPQRVIPRGLALGTGAIIVIYLLANVGYLAALGTDRAAASDHVAADAVSAVLGGGAAKLITVVILISMVSAANGITLTVPRMYYAMARDGLFFRRLADVHPRFGTPAIAIVSGSLWAMIFAATGTFEQLLTYVVFVSWIFYGLGGAAVFVFRRREPASTRPFLVPGYPITPLLFVASAAAIVLNTVVVQPGKVWVAGALLVAGLPAYWWWRKGGRDRGQESARPVVEP